MKNLLESTYTQSFLIFFFSFLTICTQLFFQEKEIPYADNISYMAVAMPLYEHGVYEDGNFKNTVLAPGENGEGMFFAPLYPTFIAGIMSLSTDLQEAAKCSIKFVKPTIIEKECKLNFLALWLTQSLLGAFSCIFIWLSALTIFREKSIALLSTLLVITLGTFSYYASIVMAEALIMPLFYMSCYFFVKSWHSQKWYWGLLTGLSVGLLVLTKPSFIYLFYFMVFLMGTLSIYQLLKHKIQRSLWLVCLSIVGVALITTPWIYRNHSKLDQAAITYGYGPFTLSQRVAYNDMTVKEWFVSWVYGIPREGGNIAKKLFPKETYERWSWEDSDGFYRYGNDVLRAKTLEEAGGHDNHLSYLLKNYVIADLPTHIMTTFPIIYRGMWVFELWVFIPYLAFLFLLWFCFKNKKYDYILYSIPPWFMLGLHGFATVNIARYNIILQSCLGMALAWIIIKGWERYKAKSFTKVAR